MNNLDKGKTEQKNGTVERFAVIDFKLGIVYAQCRNGSQVYENQNYTPRVIVTEKRCNSYQNSSGVFSIYIRFV